MAVCKASWNYYEELLKSVIGMRQGPHSKKDLQEEKWILILYSAVAFDDQRLKEEIQFLDQPDFCN